MRTKRSICRTTPFHGSLTGVAILCGFLAAACTDGDRSADKAPTRTRVQAAQVPMPAPPVIPIETPAEVEEPAAFLATDPRTASEWVDLARRRIAEGDPPGAIEAADAALALEPARPDALDQKGRALWALDRGHEAVVTFEAARRGDPGNGHIANRLGYLLITRGEYGAAVPHLEAAREALPGVPYVRNNLGVAYERVGRLAEAVEEYRAAVAAGDSGGKATASLTRLGGDVSPALSEPETEASVAASSAQTASEDATTLGSSR
jgi:tetratricopeptide (TPR) repeat protein